LILASRRAFPGKKKRVDPGSPSTFFLTGVKWIGLMFISPQLQSEIISDINIPNYSLDNFLVFSVELREKFWNNFQIVLLSFDYLKNGII
jgi:hypothetical protein